MTVPVEPGIFFLGGGGGCQFFCANETVKYLSLYNFVYMHKVLNHRDFFKDKLCQILNTFIFHKLGSESKLNMLKPLNIHVRVHVQLIKDNLNWYVYL